MQNLFKHVSREDIYQSLYKLFGHPGIVFFRERELSEINRYFDNYPLPIEKRILDLGCGEGRIGNMLFNKVDVGLDLHIDELKEAKGGGTYKNVIAASATNMPFKNGVFDIVFSNSVIEHIKGIEQVLSETSRILRNQGLFIFTVPSHKFSNCLYLATIFRKTGLGLLRLDKLYAFLRNKQLNHYNLFSDIYWHKILSNFSLEVIYKKYYLSPRDIYFWDKLCILLKITEPLGLLRQMFLDKFNRKVEEYVRQKENISLGAGLLAVAQKRA